MTRPQPRRPRRAARPAGFTLIELMIAITLGMLILSAMASAFISSSRSRDELERTSQQIENGRYAMQVLSDELRLAGYWAQLDLGSAGLTPPASKADPCSTDITVMRDALQLHIQGYDNAAASPGTCTLTDLKPNTDIVVVRRASTCIKDAAGCPSPVGAPYFQASLCNSELNSSTPTDKFRLSTTDSGLNRMKKDCVAATLADKRQFMTHIYFIANNDVALDGIPTLKRVVLGAGNVFLAPVSIAPGIEGLQLDYGIDDTPAGGDGAPDSLTGKPDTHSGCAGGTSDACTVTHWLNVVTVRVNLLARNTTPTIGHTDTKTYIFGLKADGTANAAVGPFNDGYKRHLYQSEVRLSNVAGRRE